MHHMKNYYFFLLIFFLSFFTSVKAQSFFSDDKQHTIAADQLPCEPALKYTGEEDTTSYLKFLSTLKGNPAYKMVEKILKEAGLPNGITDLTTSNSSYVQKIDFETGNYGTLSSYSKAKINPMHSGLKIFTAYGPLYLLKNGCLFFPLTNCRGCGDYDFEYDFKCKEFKTREGKVMDLEQIKPRYNKRLRFKVTNINRYLYDVQLGFDDEIMKSNEPELFKKLFLGEGFDIKNINAFAADSLNFETEALTDTLGNPMLEIKVNPLYKFLLSYVEFKQLYNSTLEYYLKAYSVCPPADLKCCDEKAQSTKFKELSEALLYLQIDYNNALAELSVEKESLESDKAKKEAELEKLEDEPGKRAKQDEIAEVKSKLDTNKQLTKSLTDFGETLKTFNDEKLLQLVHFENNFVAENFEYISPSIYPQGNYLNLNIDITPNQSKEAKKWQVMPLSEDHLSERLRVRNKWFYSFSTGPFMAIHTQFKTDTYGWQKQPHEAEVEEGQEPPEEPVMVIDGESQYKLVKTARVGQPVGIAAFANLGCKVSKWFGIGGSVGVGATILDNIRPAYFAGVTGFIGQDRQFNFTFGLSLVETEKLKKELYPGIGSQLYAAPIDLEYSKKIASGFFIALSYTVFEPVKTQNVKSGGAANISQPEPEEESPDASTEDTGTDDEAGEEPPKKEQPAVKDEDSGETLKASVKGAKKVKIKYN